MRLYSRVLLIVSIVLTTLSIPFAFIASTQVDEVYSYTARTTLSPREPRPLILIFESAEIYHGEVLSISLVNIGSDATSIVISCINETYVVMIDPGKHHVIENPAIPCTLTSEVNTSHLEITITTIKKSMPYKWLTIISLGLLIAGTALMMTFVYYRLIGDISKQRAQADNL